MNDYQKTIQYGIDHTADGGKFVLLQRCQGKFMKEINIQDLIDTNYRILTLLGMGTHIIMHQADKKDRDWWMKAIQAVVYENKPIPSTPNE